MANTITVTDGGNKINITAQGTQGPAGTGTTDPTKLPLAGGTMSGNIDMAGNNLLNEPKLDGIEAGAQVNTIDAGDNVSQLVNDVPYLSSVSGGDHTTLSNIGTNSHAQIDTHIANTANPHSVTAAQVGLGNVDNTSDLDKPVSTAQQTEIDTKEDAFSKNTAFNKDFGTSASQVCVGNDSRLSDARTPTAHAASHTDGSDDIQSATASQKGLATAAQITKLDGLGSGTVATITATTYTVLSTDSLVIMDTSSNSITSTLPAASTKTGQTIAFKKMATANEAILDGNGSETIDGNLTLSFVNNKEAYTIMSDGSNWVIV